MNWYAIGFLAPLLWSATNYIDKYLLSRYLKNDNVNVLLIFGGLSNLILALSVALLVPNITAIEPGHAAVMIAAGIIGTMALVPYFQALHKDSASAVIPIFQTIPIFNYILGYLFLNETLTRDQLIGGLLIIVGAVVLSLDFSEKLKLKTRPLLLMLLSSFFFALGTFLFKLIAIQESFWVTTFWDTLGVILVGIIAFLHARNRNDFLAIMKHGKAGIVALNFANEGITLGAYLVTTFAMLLAPIAIVSVVVSGLQPLYIFIVGLILTALFPNYIQESTRRADIIHKIIALLIIFSGTLFLRSSL